MVFFFSTLFFLCVSTCAQDGFSKPSQMRISLPKGMVLCTPWWVGLVDLFCLRRGVERGLINVAKKCRRRGMQYLSSLRLCWVLPSLSFGLIVIGKRTMYFTLLSVRSSGCQAALFSSSCIEQEEVWISRGRDKGHSIRLWVFAKRQTLCRVKVVW